MKLDSPLFLAVQTDIERFLAAQFTSSDQNRLQQAMSYSLLGGGKRIRALLVRCAAQALGDDSDRWLIPASAIEMIHAYSLIHDDLPAMDNDDLRRGKPTNHKAFDEATAILAGDALQADAFRLISRADELSEMQRIKMIQRLSEAAGSKGMVGGQMLDLLAENQTLELAALQHIHQLKTGALIDSALKLGALCSDSAQAEQLEALSNYGRAIGLAFQITDDILDVVASTATLGKPQGSDSQLQKSTYVKLLGLEGAKTQASRLVEEAHKALDASSILHCDALHDIADYVLLREY